MRRAALDQLSFILRANGLHGWRLLRDIRWGAPQLQRLDAAPLDREWPAIVGRSTTPLWASASSTERRLTAGKIENLRQALRRVNGLRIPAGEIFSFWRQIGRPTARRGFVTGRELREGCLIATIGGGLCQLSNALYAAALEAGCIGGSVMRRAE
ncbi:MAG TPA: VanW family protein [Dongiaceae bacterium]|nr:VanW family protein [Dongiaceae bacterium]